MSPSPWKDRTALVTGASSGLGADFARHLARDGVNLVLVARRTEALETLKAELASYTTVQVDLLSMDLGAPGASERLYQTVRDMGLRVDVLINNAGFGLYGEYMAIPAEKERAMIELDVLVPMALTRLFGQDMLTRREGWILQVASIGGYQPNPLYASYGAAKAFILNWGEAVHHEWRHSGVRVSVLSPGITATEFLKVSGQKATPYQRLVMMDSPTVTRVGLKALAKSKASVVPGFLNKLTLFFNRLLPRACVPPMVERLMRNP